MSDEEEEALGEDEAEVDGEHLDADEEKGEHEGEEHVEEEDQHPDNPLTVEVVSECVSLLARIGDGMSYAYIKFECTERELTSVDILCRYIYLRFVNLSNNFIKDIQPLCSMTNLLLLNVEKNQIQSVKLDRLPYVQYLNLNENQLRSLEGVNHPFLERLNVNNNQITSLLGAFGPQLDANILTQLHTLELRGNKLETTDGIRLPNLKNLFLAANMITRIEGLDQLENLTTLNLRDNQLEKLDGFTASLKSLQYLNLRGNRIAKCWELKKVQCLPSLKAIVLAENPLSEEEEYRLSVLAFLRQLVRIDKDEVEPEEREEAADVLEQKLQEEKEELAQLAEAEAEEAAARAAAEAEEAAVDPEDEERGEDAGEVVVDKMENEEPGDEEEVEGNDEEGEDEDD